MRKLLFLLVFLLFFNNSHSQKVYCQPMGEPEECILVYLAAKEFIGDTNLIIIFNPYEPLIQSLEGLTWQYNKNMYLVSISSEIDSPLRRLWVIFHEMGHVIDMYNGILEPFPVKWKGKEITNNMPWEERPWEISANKWAETIWIKLLEK